MGPPRFRGSGSGRTTLRWRLTLVIGGLTAAVGLLLLLLSFVLTDRATRRGTFPFPFPGFFTDPQTGRPLPGPNGLPLTVADVQDQVREQALRQLYTQGLLALLVLIVLGVLLAYVLSGRVLRPLQQITATAQRLSAEQLSDRINLPGPHDELKVLADTFDAMLARLQASFESQQRFVADASHELRTPLAVMRTEVDVALADPHASAADLRTSAEVVRAATDRAGRLVDSLLLLARTDAISLEGLPVTEPVELSAVTAAGLSAVADDIADLGLSVQTAWGDAVVLGDPGLLERLAGNLVENAVRHNVAGGFVQASTGTTDDGRAWLTVANSGAVIPAGEVDQLFEPFRRHGTARTARRGAGLGLSICRVVARVHGGTVEAVAHPGGGLVVRVDLPRSPQQTFRA